MSPNAEDVQVAMATHTLQLQQHSTDIVELKQLAHDTLESMRIFSERVTRLITLQEMAHTPETCPLRSRQDEVANMARNIDAQLTQMRVAVEHTATLFATHEDTSAARDKRLTALEKFMHESEQYHAASLAKNRERSGWLEFFVDGKWANIALLITALYWLVQKFFPNAIP